MLKNNDLDIDDLFDCCVRLQVISSLLSYVENLPRLTTFYDNLNSSDYFYFLFSCLESEVDRFYNILLD